MAPDLTKVKICGITTEEALQASVHAGVAYLGFVFYKHSPRAIDHRVAKTLTNKTPSNLMNVGLFVDPKITDIQEVLDHADLDMIQLHGNESPKEIQAIRAAFGLPVMKALRISNEADLSPIQSFEKVCDWLLFDAKSEKAQGGSGESFDWSILSKVHLLKPWMLAGGLNKDNVDKALSILKPTAVDVSSGVEDSPGIKNPGKIKEFIAAVQQKV